MSAVTERLSVLFPQNGLLLVETQILQLDRYAALLKEWNEKMNLTAITDDEGICVKHFLDCALALRCVESAGAKLAGSKVIDVGTGAGFPGVVWKILRPDMELTLLDSPAEAAHISQCSVRGTGFAGGACAPARGGRRP